MELSRIVAALPSSTPFTPPEVLERQRGRKFAVRLGANESSFGASPKAYQAIKDSLTQIQHYTDGTHHELKTALSQHLQCSEENLVVGPGIDGLLGHIARVLLNPGDKVVTSLGGYPTTEYAVIGVGGELVKVSYLQNGPDLLGLARTAGEVGAKIVYLANPDNPSGAWQNDSELDSFIAAIPEDTAIILDEAYAEFAPSIAAASKWLHDPRIIRLRTFSKVYGMAGMRVAYAIGHPDTIGPINRIRMHFEVNILAYHAALASLKDQAFARWVVEETRKGREEYHALARELGLTSVPSETNFVAIDVGGRDRAIELIQQLGDRGIFIRMPWAAPLNRCIRVSVGLLEERAVFASAMRELISNC
ncbi:MAG: aminotransferase class I/II-fold pyridoxal phosphate-dependent enzyme [Fimbriimonas sp.]